MWNCPTCGEPIDDQFDSCWKCTKPDLTGERTEGRGPERRPRRFFRYWSRGWFVLLMFFCLSLFAGGVNWLLSALLRQHEALFLAGTLGFLFLLLPVFAYWLFLLFFGDEAWPLRSGEREVPRGERAFALLDEATRLESQGRVPDALAKYQAVVDNFGGTTAGRDAQKAIESLRAETG